MGRPSRGYKLRELPGGCWQVRFSHAGKRYELSTEELDLDRAEAKARQIYAAVISGRWVPGSQLAAPGAPVWQVAAGWLDAIEPMVVQTTRKQYGIYVTAHWQPHFKEMESFARPGSVPAYIRARLKVVRRRSLQKELSALRGFLAWCHEVGHLPEAILIPKLTVKSPGHPDERKKHKSVPIELTVSDVRAILDLLPEMSKGSRVRPPFPVRDFFTVCYETGLRPDATVAQLEPEDLRAGELAVRDEIDKARFGRSVPLTPLARECLERHATRPGKPIFGKASRATYLRAAALLAGKPGVSAYDFRHARATHLMESSGNNILGVGYLLGHTQATTTNRYAKQTHRAAMTVLQQGGSDGGGAQRAVGQLAEGDRRDARVGEEARAQHDGDAQGHRRDDAGQPAQEVREGHRAHPERPIVSGTTGNAEVRKKGVEPSREVIPQEPERSDLTEITLRTSSQLPGERQQTSTNDSVRQESWVSAPDVFDLAAALARVLRRAS